MLMRYLFGVECEVQLTKHVLELDPLPICDLFADVHLQFELVIFELICKNLIIFLNSFFIRSRGGQGSNRVRINLF